jgi:hypothetical protein
VAILTAVDDEFAPKLIPEYHVYGITRRGYGASSKRRQGTRPAVSATTFSLPSISWAGARQLSAGSTVASSRDPIVLDAG